MFELVTALRLAEPGVAAGLRERFRADIETMVEGFSALPRETVRRILADDGFDVAGFLGEGSRGGPHTTDLFMRAARLGDPETAGHIYQRRQYMDPAVLAEVLAHVDDELDDGWYTERGLVNALRAAVNRDPLSAATLPFAALVYKAAADRCAFVPYATAVDLCVAVADRGSPVNLLALAKEDLGHPGLAAMLIQAAESPDPSAYLADRRPPEEWLDAAAVRAYLHVVLANDSLRSVDERPPLDWDLVRREHERRPLGTSSLGWLTSWDGCPEDLVREALKASRPVTALRHATWLPFDIVSNAGVLAAGHEFDAAMERGIAAGWMPVDRVLKEAAPANRMLSTMPDTPEVRVALADLFAPFGEDPDLWLTFYKRLPRFEGTATELVAAIAAIAPQKRTTAWPRPLAPAYPASEPENTRALFLKLLRLLPDAVTVALAPRLDARAVQHLLVFHTLSERVRDALVAAHGVPALASYAAASSLTEDEVDWLLEHDEPAVDAMLFAHARVPDDERIRILSGVRRDGGRERVAPEVLAVLEEINLGHYRTRLTMGIDGGDPGVAGVILRRLRLGTELGRLRLLAAVWERYGPAEVGELLDIGTGRLPVATTKSVRKLLANDDGLTSLRDRIVSHRSPQETVAYLAKKTKQPEDHLRRAIQEGMDIPWPELAEATRADRLPPRVVGNLAVEAGCTREFAIAAFGVYARHGETVARWGRTWREQILRKGSVSPEDLLLHGTSPSQFLSLIARHPQYSRDKPVQEPCAEARALAAEMLGDDVEAWTVAIRMFDDFTGTVPELFATARAAVS